VLFAVIVWQVGRPVRESESTTTIGYFLPGSPAEKAGMKAGDVIKEIDGKPIKRWQGMSSDSVVWRIVTSEDEKIEIKYGRDGQEHVVMVKPEIPATKIYQRRATRQLLIEPAETPVVEKVAPGSAAEKAGLRRGDFIVEANDQPIFVFEAVADAAQANPDAPLLLTVERDNQRVKLTEPLVLAPPSVEQVFENSPGALAGVRVGDRIERVNDTPVFAAHHVTQFVEERGEKPLTLHVIRDGEKLALTMTPAIPIDEKRPKLGLQFREDTLGLGLAAKVRPVHPPPLEQIRLSAMSIINTLGVIVSRKSDVGAQHLGGPLMMLRIYYVLFETAEGWKLALWFSVLLNVNLAILNLLPLPVLDGGHIMLALLEIVRRRPVEGRILQWVQTACAVLLIGFMLFITFFDVQDFFGRGGMKFAPKAGALK
ncbi:MAG TPA: PDZ domain-containing protein, partial [Tepidisphaeraceae bacterium]|nr:PDZ domain-containing protein [Tepidisphaeraceae bacterium]